MKLPSFIRSGVKHLGQIPYCFVCKCGADTFHAVFHTRCFSEISVKHWKPGGKSSPPLHPEHRINLRIVRDRPFRVPKTTKHNSPYREQLGSNAHRSPTLRDLTLRYKRQASAKNAPTLVNREGGKASIALSHSSERPSFRDTRGRSSSETASSKSKISTDIHFSYRP